MNNFGEAEIWFCPGSVDLYGQDALAVVGEQSAAIARALDQAAAIPARVVLKPVLTTRDDMRRTMLEANAADACIGVIAWMHTFSPAKAWIGALSVLAKPMLHLHTQFNRPLPYGEIDMDFMNLNQSAHGDREFAHMVSRLRMRRSTVAGHWTDPAVLARVGTWVRAAYGIDEARRLRVMRIGDNMRYVAVTDGDKVEAEARLGFTVNSWGVDDLTAVVADVSSSAADELARQYVEEYDVVPELRPDGERFASLVEQARIELALREMLTAGGFGAFTDTFEDLGALTQLPSLAVQRLMADGYGFGAEGDWKSAALLRIVKVMTTGLPGGSSFMEDYSYDLAPERTLILGAHMAEVCPSIAAAKPAVRIAPLLMGNRADPPRLVFDAAAGTAQVFNWLDLGNRFRMVVNTVDVVEPPEPLPNLPVARALWRPRPDLATSAESWLLAGAPHHTVLSHAASVDLLRTFTDLLGIEMLVIDDATTVPALANEIRWNEAYHQLAARI